MEITPANVRQLAEQKDAENFRFRTFLKCSSRTAEELDKLVFQTADEVWAKVDCTACANCCKEVVPLLDQQDVQRLAARLGQTPQQIIDVYLKPEEDPDEAGPRWEMRTAPCPFLKDNRCSVYEDRPAACRKYPYLHEPRFVFRLLGMLERAATCPIVFEVLEKLKERTGYQDSARLDEDQAEWLPETVAPCPELLTTEKVPWEAIRALAARLEQDDELLDAVLSRLLDLVPIDAHTEHNYEALYLLAALALAGPALSDEQQPRAAFALVDMLTVAAICNDECCSEILSATLRAFPEAAVPAALQAISGLPADHVARYHLWGILQLIGPESDGALREEVAQVCMDSLKRVKADESDWLDAKQAAETLAILKHPEARPIIQDLAQQRPVTFGRVARLYDGAPLPKTREQVQLWVERKRQFLEQWYFGGGQKQADPATPKRPLVSSAPKVGRNDPCPCGSGKKYKKCCLR